MELTKSQEDYLEAILALIRETGNARVSDIADRLHVAKPSVTFALQRLAERELVNYEPYQLISLTEAGKSAAERIHRKHRGLSRFLQDVLDIDEDIAEANACLIEHAVTEGLVRRLSCFGDFMAASSISANQLTGAFREYCHEQLRTGSCDGCKTAAGKVLTDQKQRDKLAMSETLADLKPGEKAKIIRVGGEAAANKRLLEMGLTRGAPLCVVRVAPLGDPVEIKVRGYNLSLRKTEARTIEIERIT